MRWLMVTSALALALASDARAEESDWRWSFALAPIALPSHTLLHESSHAFAGVLTGYVVTEFKPWPHAHDKHYFLGHVRVGKILPSTQGERLTFYAAPYVMDVALFATSDLLLSRGVVKQRSWAGALLYTFGVAAPFLDFAKGYMHGVDWQSIRSLSTSRAWTANIIGAVVLALGAWRIIQVTRRFWK